MAVHESFNTLVAQVAAVTVKGDSSFSVDRVVCAVDCGIAVNSDNVRAQMEGGLGFGLSAALHAAITIKDVSRGMHAMFYSSQIYQPKYPK